MCSVNAEVVLLPSVILGNMNTALNLSKPTGHVMHQQVKHSRILHSTHTVFMCFIFISEQMATFAPYRIN